MRMAGKALDSPRQQCDDARIDGCEGEKETAMKLTPEKVRELAIGLAVLCLVILVAIGVAVWWVDQTAP